KKLQARIYVNQAYVGVNLDKEKAAAAIQELQDLVKTSPSTEIEVGDESVPALQVIGVLYMALDDTDKALEAFKRLSEGSSSTGAAYFRLAQLYYQKNKFRDAATAARKAYDLQPNQPQFASLLAKALQRTGRAQEALEVFQKVFGRDKDKPGELPKEALIASPLLFDYAEALVFAGKYDDAAKLLDPIIKNANHGDPMYLRAVEVECDSLRRGGKREDAIKLIEEAIKGQDVSESLSLLYGLAETYEEMQQFEKAIDTYEEALTAILNPDGTVGNREQDKQNVGVILRRINLAYRTIGKSDKAAATVERMRKVLGPASQVADQVVLDTLIDEGRFKEALEAARNASVRFPKERSFKLFAAQASGRLDDLPAAEGTLKSLLNGSSEDVETYLFLATVQLDSNRLKEAEESARKAASLDPGDISPLVTLSTVQERQKKYKDSEGTLRKALEIDPDNATVLNNLGYFLADRNERLSEAEDLIRRAVNIQPTNGSFLDSLGWVLYRAGKSQEALKYLEQATIYSPRSVTIHDHLGDLYKKLGQTDKARTAWQTALRLGTELRFQTDPDEINRIKEKLGQKK
ncbi:MAG TPA: tetratricopeptide repeat protein, partial [Blastocatellia bacterium]|nr:tetratricopeptide repeat protein [Blastocatellia bacterium]